MPRQRFLTRTIVFVLLVTLAWLGAVALGWSSYGNQMSRYATDVFFRLQRRAKPDTSRIVLVAIDDETLSRFGNLPIDRLLVARALNQICRGQPRVVGLDIWFPEQSNPESDQALVAALRACPQTVLASSLVRDEPDSSPHWVDPLPDFARAAGAIAHVHADPDEDGVSRQILLAKTASGRRRWALALEAFRIEQGHNGPVVEDQRTLVVGTQIIPAAAATQRALIINYAGPEGVFPRYSFRQVAEGAVPPEKFTGRAVLLGVTAQGVGDRLFTPVTASGRGMPGGEIHANALHTLMTASFLYPLRETSILLVMAGTAAAVGLALALLTGVWLGVALVLLAVAVHAAPYLLFERRLIAPAFSFSVAFWGPLVAGGVFRYLTVWRGYRDADATSRRLRDRMELVAHEVRSPLTAIQGSSEVMSRYPLDDERRRQLAELIHRESQRVAGLVQRFLDVERLSAGELELRREPVSLRALIALTLERTEPLARRKDIRIATAMAGEPMVMGDAELLEFALYNLVSNAIKYSPEASTVQVSVGSNQSLALGYLEVTDQGAGIPREDQSRIFDRFFRSEGARRSGQPGLGLGLSIVREIARHHGGSVLVESTPGSGSKFSLALPLFEEEVGQVGA